MLGGLDPIILFNFKKLPPIPTGLEAIPITPVDDDAIPLPIIPIYLSESITGVYIDSEDKSIDVDTTVDALSSGGTPQTTQRPISNTVKISMKAKKGSIGLMIFSALADLILPKVTSKEYSITYLHGAVTVFAGLLHSFSINQNANDELYLITLELVKPPAAPLSKVPFVPRDPSVPALRGGIP